MAYLPPKPRHELAPEQQALHDHFRETVTHVLTTDATYTNHTSHLPDLTGVNSASSRPSDGPITGIFPFLSALPTAGRLSLDLLRTLGQEMVRLNFPADARETAALVAMSHFKADFAVYAHAEIARKYELLSAEQIDGLREEREVVEGLSEGCRLAREMTRELLEKRGRVEGELWERCLDFFGVEGTVLLVNYVGLFVWTSLGCNVAGA